MPGTPQAFAENKTNPTHKDKNGKHARYRPVGVTVGPDGAL